MTVNKAILARLEEGSTGGYETSIKRETDALGAPWEPIGIANLGSSERLRILYRRPLTEPPTEPDVG